MKLKVIAGILLIILTFGLYLVKNFSSGENKPADTGALIVQSADDSLEKNPAESEDGYQNSVDSIIIVDVGGAVQKPGIVELPEDSRVYKAIEKAGGLKRTADTKSVNLAAKLSDGEKLYIPAINESVSPSGGSNSSSRININTANSDALQKINGIGPSTASKIIAYRENNGPFKKIEEIKDVSGIGEKTFSKLKNQISIN